MRLDQHSEARGVLQASGGSEVSVALVANALLAVVARPDFDENTRAQRRVTRTSGLIATNDPIRITSFLSLMTV